MDIIKIIKENSQNIILEDLDFFEVELATGDYSLTYITECSSLIVNLRNWLKTKVSEKNTEDMSNPVLVTITLRRDKIEPGLEISKSENDLDNVVFMLKTMRAHIDYKELFKRYISKNNRINENFISDYFALFVPWEMDMMLKTLSFSEEFLETYFSLLNKDKLARYQSYSESFFLNHSNELDINKVVQNTKNEWIKKDKRSKQLNIFLRLKGVTK